MTTKITTLKGFRDFLPEEMRIRTKVINTLKTVFASFGFQPLETPALEYAETLMGKYGAEADRLVYTFTDRGGRRVGLRYDLTVPLARVAAQYQSMLVLPFKRYQIQPVWRAEKPQKGRFREFYQCDVDTVGTTSPLADAEIIATAAAAFRKLGLKEFTVRINSRPALFKLLEEAGLGEKELRLSILRTLDKLDKKSKEEVNGELRKKGLLPKTCERLMTGINSAEADENLKAVVQAAIAFGVDEKRLKFDPALVRGLDYYTGLIFEVSVEEPKIGSLAGGGRYDELIGQLGGRHLPAVGISLGLERIIEVVKEFDLLLGGGTPAAQILVTVFDKSLVKESQKLYTSLRSSGCGAEIYLDPEAKLEKQLKYADRNEIPLAVILGPEEISKNKVTIKDLRSGQQKTINREEAVAKLKPEKPPAG